MAITVPRPKLTWFERLYLPAIGAGMAITLQHFKNMLRSEEHTSELQSLTKLVCRLLLEKKTTRPTTMRRRRTAWNAADLAAANPARKPPRTASTVTHPSYTTGPASNCTHSLTTAAGPTR